MRVIRRNGVVPRFALMKWQLCARTSEIPNQYCGIAPSKVCSGNRNYPCIQHKIICAAKYNLLTCSLVLMLTVGWIVQMSTHNSGISEVPVIRATNSPPCLIVTHLNPSLHHCFSTSKTYVSLTTTGIDCKKREVNAAVLLVYHFQMAWGYLCLP